MNCLICASKGDEVELVEAMRCPKCGSYINKDALPVIISCEEKAENVYQELLAKIKKEIEAPGELELTIDELSRIDLGDYVKMILSVSKGDSRTKKLKVAKMIFDLLVAESESNLGLLIEIANYALALSIRVCRKPKKGGE